jgi:hypothetical protein
MFQVEKDQSQKELRRNITMEPMGTRHPQGRPREIAEGGRNDDKGDQLVHAITGSILLPDASRSRGAGRRITSKTPEVQKTIDRIQGISGSGKAS